MPALEEMTATAMKTQLVALSRELGFDSCRVARCDSPKHADEFRAWLREGAEGEMNYMRRGEAKRCDPQMVLSGARSVVVLAMNYWQGGPETAKRKAETGKMGRIARYAWGDDYHEVIEKRLEKLDDLLSEFGGSQKCYVDTGPVLERDFAAEAGVGWHGKSTMLLNRELGTWFFLAEILTTLELPEDAPQREHCGTCTRCITACPTGAITGPHRLDARRCISYLTIELKGAIPLELRPLVGDRIYGCDDCLEACPWNRFAKTSNEAAFAARPALQQMSLTDFLRLDDSAFRALFRRSPIKRIKRRGFLRNVCVALGNVGTSEDLAALENAARDPDSLISEHATWAIAQIRTRGKPPPAN
jgi:epoxyqueuosine reductase